ncbi:MAG: hypothetical protein WC869_04475 [Phycisphaerae bacterium]|jgi:outer membrane lipoprotein-sorting protein
MKRFVPLMLTIVLAVSVCACAQGPAEATSQPAAASQPADPGAIKILDRLEQAGVKFQTLQGDLSLTVDMPQLGDREARKGWVAYQRASGQSPEKIRVHFDTLQQGEGPDHKEKLDYAFDGEWATEAKFSVKQLTRWQVAAPGEKIEAMRIGKGAFPPLPFGQKTAEVLEYYQASVLPAAQGDPANTDAIKLVARRERRKDVDFLSLEIWVARDSGLPIKVVGTDKDKNVKTVMLTNVQGGKKFDDNMFELKAGWGWTTNTQPLPQRTPGE